MSCKAKKNEQEKFHLAFICYQVRLCFFACSTVTLRQRCPRKKDFLITPMVIALTYILRQDSLCSSTITLLSILPRSGFFLPTSRGKTPVCTVTYILHPGQATRAARQHHIAGGLLQRCRDPLTIWSSVWLGWWQGAGFELVLRPHYFDNDLCSTDIFFPLCWV